MALATLGSREEAEAELLASIDKLLPRDDLTTRAHAFVARFYEDWNRIAPDPARAARAADWRAKAPGEAVTQAHR